ncbi:MAG: hypothetical protein Q8N81_01465, partial [bacterium]|nr:hypothetical protein [bacterium]
WITWALLSYQLWIIQSMAGWPFAAIAVQNFPLSWAGIYYVLLAVLIFVFYIRGREKKIADFRNFSE